MKETYTQEDLVKYLDAYILNLEADITIGSAFLDQASPMFSTSQKLIREGIVVRNREAFHYDDFQSNVAKYVRANHVTNR